MTALIDTKTGTAVMPFPESSHATGCVVLADGTVFLGAGFGAEGHAVGEVCFNTAMTGYQEILTDPSYAGQIITFTFPHVGNVGTTHEDCESVTPSACGAIVRWQPTKPSNWRSESHLSDWMSERGMIGVGDVDSRALTRKIRETGAPHATIIHCPEGQFNIAELRQFAVGFPGLDGADLASEVTNPQGYDWRSKRWQWPEGFTESRGSEFQVAAIDYGVKRNLLRCLTDIGASVKVFSAETQVDDIIDAGIDGLFLSNGPGDPAATGQYAVPLIRDVIKQSDLPVFGICLGHQMLALALGGRTIKMQHGHHGANHPVKDLRTGKVEITSMNHGFMVDRDSLPQDVEETHISLFDGTNCGLQMRKRPVFSVQFHPEASPGPQDSFYLFEQFADSMRARRQHHAKSRSGPQNSCSSP